MVHFASRLFLMSVVRESPPVYGLSPALAPAPAIALVREQPAVYGDGFLPTDDESDVIVTLGDEIATLAAHIYAATHRLLVLLAEFDRRGGWELEGHRSCAHWLAFRTGIDLGAAREKVRAAQVLVGLPETGAAMARGELSFSQVRALTRVATADNEGDLLELARGCTTAQLERVVRGWKRGSRQDEAARERERHESRAFSVFPDDDGMYVVRGKLPPEVGALLMRAVEAASDALYRDASGIERDRGGRAGRGGGVLRYPACRRPTACRRAGAPGRAGHGGGVRRAGGRRPRGRCGARRGRGLDVHQRHAGRPLPGGAARGCGDAGRGWRVGSLRVGRRHTRFS